MADWSHLPEELLHLISTHLPTETDLLRFRSVCATWRSSIHPFSSRFPILPSISSTTWGLFLSKRTIFRISLPDPNPTRFQTHPWLIKVQRDNPHKTRLMNPLTGSDPFPVSPTFPKHINLLNFRVTEVGQEYALQYINYRPNANSIGDAVTLYVEKVAFCNVGIDGFVLLTIHVSGKLALLRNGDKEWNIIDGMPRSPYDDVLFYNGEFYAVDGTGGTVVVEWETGGLIRVVAGSVFGGDKKYLVESGGELFMVDKYLSDLEYDGNDEDDEENDEFVVEDFECVVNERTVKLEVYKLDKEEGRWVEVKDLGDRMLFLGENCGFSASVEEFPGCKGNCVFFTGQNREDDGLVKCRDVDVFDLETGSIGSVDNDVGYSQLFWPPPRWLYSDSLNLEDGLDNLNI